MGSAQDKFKIIDYTKEIKFSYAGCNAHMFQKLDGSLCLKGPNDNLSDPIVSQENQGNNVLLKTSKCGYLVPGGLSIHREMKNE